MIRFVVDAGLKEQTRFGKCYDCETKKEMQLCSAGKDMAEVIHITEPGEVIQHTHVTFHAFVAGTPRASGF